MNTRAHHQMIGTDFERKVYCILGLPFDALNYSTAEQIIRTAATSRSPCFFSTPNLNFLIACQTDAEFRNSVINSDVSVADGMPLVWMARLLGIPIRERVAGADLFERLQESAASRLSVYFFGGIDGVAEAASQKLSTERKGLVCAGFSSPGFGSIEDMSTAEIIDRINASGADFLVVALGAKKGQAWIMRNRARLTVPVVSHLGAVVNFVAGTVRRAPVWMQRNGLEWLWRIKEEPGLWRRYWRDGLDFVRLLATRVLPYAWYRGRHSPDAVELAQASAKLSDDGGIAVIRICGAWDRDNLAPLRQCFSQAVEAGGDIRLDLTGVSHVDSAFVGLLMLLYGHQASRGVQLLIGGLQPHIRRVFELSCAEYILQE